MKVWSWIKGAANVSTGGLSSLYLYGALVLAGVAMAAGTFVWHSAQVREVRDEAFKSGRMEVENDQLRETQREMARMVGVVNNLNEAYREQAELIEGLRFAAVADADRMRQLTDQRRAALAAAPAEAVRDYAATAADVYAACRSEYRALGLDARSCSATAHTLDQYANEVSGRPTPPSPPTPPSRP